jgi:retron-type reverse transcriptase
MEKAYKEITKYENIHKAYIDARRGKRYRASILKFEYRLGESLWEIKQELSTKSYSHGGYREFIVSDSKKRSIKAPLFRDRVVHHALCNIIEPILDKTFIYDSYACRKGKGTHAAVKRLEKFLRSARGSAPVFCLKCDISKYFDSVDQDTLLKILSKKIKDEEIKCLIAKIVRSVPRGIPIGNLTSQLFANAYLNELDQYIKRFLREKYYVRYMDDFLILGDDKRHLYELKEKIRLFLKQELKLTLHPKKATIFPVNKGIDFLGYVLKNGKRRLRKSTVKRFLKKRKKYLSMMIKGRLHPDFIKSSNTSWRGYAKFADSYMLRKKMRI